MGVRRFSMKMLLILFVLFLVFFLVPNISAERNEVCLVYFISSDCGDDCFVVESFIDSLMIEYAGTLTAIKYSIDASQENMNVHEAYKTNYGLPHGVPSVLFGEDDYLVGKYDIYDNFESKILNFISANGTNCPLESGYVPPSNLNPVNLPGQLEVLHEEEPEEEGEEGESDEIKEAGEEEGELSETPTTEDMSEIELPFWMLWVGVIVVIVIVLAFGMGKKR